MTFVSDGDSLMVRPASGGAPVKIRINGVDAPESCQAYGPESRQALQSRVMGRTVTLDGQRRDNYGRVLARIYLNDGKRTNSGTAGAVGNAGKQPSSGKADKVTDGEDIGQWMVRQGHAWSYRFRRDAGPYAAEESQARAARRGLFAGTQAGQSGQSAQILEPRDFRKRHGPCDRPLPAVKR